MYIGYFDSPKKTMNNDNDCSCNKIVVVNEHEIQRNIPVKNNDSSQAQDNKEPHNENVTMSPTTSPDGEWSNFAYTGVE